MEMADIKSMTLEEVSGMLGDLGEVWHGRPAEDWGVSF